jgi:CRP-like cAMP-binding protein
LFQNIFNNLRKVYPFEDSELDYFRSHLEVVVIPKKTIYYKIGDAENCLSFVNKGLLKCYVHDPEGKEVIMYFCKEDYWAADINSFYLKEPSRFQFETIEETELLQISHERLTIVLKEMPSFEAAFHNLLKRYIINFHERYIHSQTKTALERYEIFENKFPDLIQRVPQKSIASYLGVTPEFLSKMRAERK